ncbi:phosphonate metabolism protein PhnM [Salinicoccus hispanicus]|uniref:Phosphonate metabolism protein PhnM n=1 Tax=Salinicoccus hispanicus TaxID=157225 RepID=A0A6N8U277_9STAP|nr:phosphonate metabolism protein PhnM [Salinicoccus hispanicus]MXQ51066.1 phosphonate metabolism protein PhnM [Salinicoccus hispanicus]
MKAIINGNIITEDEILENAAVVIDEQYIVDIVPMAEADTALALVTEVIDARGGYVSPGFIDIHSDYIEGIVAPRPTSLMDVNMGIRESERILSSHGITTMFHSLSIYREDLFGHKPIREPRNVEKLIQAIARTHHEKHLIRHRLHTRFELDAIEMLPILKQHIEAGNVHLLSFMDHTPGQGQYRNLSIYRDTVKSYQNMSDTEIEQKIVDKAGYAQIGYDEMKEVADLALVHNIAVASHDDDRTERIDFNETIGTTISEFPITMEVAKYAYSRGQHTMAGAPNIMLGGSHSGNLNAKDAIEADCISILCSDYYPAAMLHSVYKLHNEYNHPLEEAMKLITINPARAVHMDHEIGSIAIGKKADINVIQCHNDYPVVTECIVDGAIISQYHYRIDEEA